MLVHLTSLTSTAIGQATSHSGIQTVESVVALMIVATTVGMVAHRIRVPYTVSLVLVGLGLRAFQISFEFQLTQDLLLMVFLPALLFEAAIHFPANELRKFAPTIATLAVPGVFLSAIFTALVLQLGFSAFGFAHPISFVHFLLFGTIIAATDPVSVITLFRQLKVDRRLSVLIEGESLFNDGTAIVLYTAVLSVLQSGLFEPSQALMHFIAVCAGGIFIGILLGLFGSSIFQFVDDHLIAIALTTVIAYGSFLCAEQLHVSGVLATVSSGLLVGNIGKRRRMSPTTRIAVVSFWEYVAFFIGSIVFLLIGLETDLSLLFQQFWLILLAFAAVLVSRLISVFLPMPILRQAGQAISAKTATILWWSGLRGSLSMVLALSLPKDMGMRDVLISMTFGVVLLSVVLQGSTVGTLLRILGFVKKETQSSVALAQSLARLKAIWRQKQALARFVDQGWPKAQLLKIRLEEERQHILAALEEHKNQPEMAQAIESKLAEMESHLLLVAKDSYRTSLAQSLINEQQMEMLLNQLEEPSSKPSSSL